MFYWWLQYWLINYYYLTRLFKYNNVSALNLINETPFCIKKKWKNTQKSPIYNETKQTQPILRGRWSVCWRLRVLMDVYLRQFIAVYDVP